MKQRTIDTFYILKDDVRKRTLEESNSTDQYIIDRVHAIIYKWEFTPPFPHVLENCCYFGQTKKELHERTRQHKLDSLANPKELGLHALWKQFPYDSYWNISLLEETYFDDVVSAGEWMNQREIDLIGKNGGILRNMNAKLKQTLNLTSGGQGDPKKVYEALLARSRKKLDKIWPAFKQFYAREKHWHIPRDHKETVNGEEIQLGQIVSGIRRRKDFLQHVDFAMWLWCGCFKMHTRNGDENTLRWNRVFKN